MATNMMSNHIDMQDKYCGYCYNIHFIQSQCKGTRFQISDFRFQISDFRFQVSDFRFQVSGFRFQISDFRFQISDFRFDSRPPDSRPPDSRPPRPPEIPQICCLGSFAVRVYFFCKKIQFLEVPHRFVVPN